MLSGLVALALAAALPSDALEAKLRALFEAQSELPGMRVRALRIEESRALVGLELPRGVRKDDLPPAVENRFEEAVGMIDAERPSVRAFELQIAYPGEPLARPPRRAKASVSGDARPPRRLVQPDPARFPDGQALAGKIVAISPGHGYIYYDSLSGYGTQRGRVYWNDCGGCRGIVEDFETHEIVVRNLVPLLEGAGARVVLVRERDYNGAGTTVEETAAQPVAGTFTADPGAGASGGAAKRASEASASMEWTLTPAASGPQLLSMWFPSASELGEGARLELSGPFGLHRFTVDQRTHGRRWTPIALLDLDAGAPLVARLSPGSDGRPASFDAFRLGAGLHSTMHRWWEMGAEPFMEREGAPSSVSSLGDVTTRPAYAEWQDADVYFALHSNASGSANSTAVGTSSYRYNCGSFPDHSSDPPAAQCDDPAGSDRLQELVHRRFIEQLRADWDPNWADRGTRVANFGEVRGLVDMPGMLMESAFHDNVQLAGGSTLRMTENQALHDPRWRRAAAYGMYKGLSEFLVGAGPTVLPPPRELVAQRAGPRAIALSFEAVPGATRYRVYVAQRSRAFDQGRLTEATSLRVEDLEPELPVLLKVAALNAAGEGLPSAVVAARPSARPAQLLLVDAFEREDAWVQDIDNRRDTLGVHARALAGVEHAFDSATEAAWAAGAIRLDAYDGMVIALGRESTEHRVLSAPLRDALAAFAAAGGAVFASGSEIGWALDARGDASTRAFLDELFGVTLAEDSAPGASLSAAPGGFLAMAGALPLDEGDAGGLAIKSLDSFTPGAGAIVELRYSDMSAAAVRKATRLVMGTPLDSVAGEAARERVLGAWAAAAVPLVPITPPTDAGVPFVDAGAPADDAGLDASTDTGATEPPDAAKAQPDAESGAPDASTSAPDAVGLYAASDPPISGGCGCGVASPAETMTLFVVLSMLWMLRSRRWEISSPR